MEKSYRVAKMNAAAANWPNLIAEVAGPYQGHRKGWLSRAAYKTGVKFRQISALYYGQTTNPRYEVAVKIITAAEQARLEKARRDARTVADIYSRTAEALSRTDPDFHRNDIAILVEAARIIGNRDRT